MIFSKDKRFDYICWTLVYNKFKMSNKKDDKKKGKKDKDKDRERELMAAEEARKEQERQEAQQRSNFYIIQLECFRTQGF